MMVMKAGMWRKLKGKSFMEVMKAGTWRKPRRKVIHGGDESRNVERAEEKSHSWR
ncbi:hypothetical protein [Halalkalibacter wakoensis]|uniref:hypothetical protein n=1 Tax=Halalkalibacter wakoensis TaxID=127891 RepID=UPI0012E2AB8E|nr:hypothetical protein [Halalkalibacter wakoensis]